MQTNRTPIAVAAAMFLGVFALANVATAHGLSLWAYVEESKVFVEALFSDGRPIRNAGITVMDANKTLVTEGVTDLNGSFIFDAGEPRQLNIRIDVDRHHAQTFTLEADDFEADAKPEEPSTSDGSDHTHDHEHDHDHDHDDEHTHDDE